MYVRFLKTPNDEVYRRLKVIWAMEILMKRTKENNDNLKLNEEGWWLKENRKKKWTKEVKINFDRFVTKEGKYSNTD